MFNRLFKTTAFSALMALMVSPASASDLAPYWSSEHWDVQKDVESKTCSLWRTFEKKATGETHTFNVTYSAVDKRVNVVFVDPDTTSLPDEGEVKLKVIFFASGSSEVDDGWGERTFKYSKLEQGHIFISAYTGLDNVRDMLSDLSKSKSIGFFTDRDVIVTAFPLDESTPAIAQMKRCSFAIAGLRSDDPFLQ